MEPRKKTKEEMEAEIEIETKKIDEKIDKLTQNQKERLKQIKERADSQRLKIFNKSHPKENENLGDEPPKKCCTIS